MTTDIITQSSIMNDEDRKDLMISIGGKFLDNTEEIMNSLNFTPEEKGDFMMNLISFSRCLFIHASHEQMQLKNDIKWDTLKKSHDMDRNKLRDMMRIGRTNYNH